MERQNAKIDSRLARNKRSFVLLLLHIRSRRQRRTRPTGRTITAVTIDPRPRSWSKYVRDRSRQLYRSLLPRLGVQYRYV